MHNEHLTFYREQLHLQNAVFTLIEHEDAIVAHVYKVTLPDGTDYILKICLLARHYARELYFLHHFADQIPVPRIIGHVLPNHNMNGAILMECLRGTILKKEDLTPELAFQMGMLLAKIHQNRTAGYGDLTQPDALMSSPHKPFIEKFQTHLAECKSHLSSQLIKQCEMYLQEHLFLLDSVDGPCIVHWDFRPGNIMVLNEMVQGVIDWSSSRSDFAEEDFCNMEHTNWAANPNIKDPFLAGYKTIRPVPDYRNIMPLLRLSKALGGMGFTIKTNTWLTKNAVFYQTNKAFVETFFCAP